MHAGHGAKLREAEEDVHDPAETLTQVPLVWGGEHCHEGGHVISGLVVGYEDSRVLTALSQVIPHLQDYTPHTHTHTLYELWFK